MSGEDCFVAHLQCGRMEDVSALLARLQAIRAIQTSHAAFVLETVAEKGARGPRGAALVVD